MDIKIIKEPISRKELEAMAQELFGDYIKAVVDIKQNVAALGGGLHADEETELLKQGSKQDDLWGINLYPQKSRDGWVEFDSMINIRPSQGNRSRSVESREVQNKIKKIINKLVTE